MGLYLSLIRDTSRFRATARDGPQGSSARNGPTDEQCFFLVDTPSVTRHCATVLA